MNGERSREAFMAFLDHLSEKGLIPQNSAASRKATAGKVFVVLTPDEAADVTKIDIEEVMIRFENKNRGKYTTESLQTYRSRLKNSLSEFEEFCANPFSFKPRRRLVVKTRNSNVKPTSTPISESAGEGVKAPALGMPASSSVFPIALWPNLTVQIAGLPFDLTKAEAQKIANIILAHAAES